MTESDVQIPVRNRLIGSQLRGLREGAGMSVERVMRELGIDRSKAYRHETGRTAVSKVEAEAYMRLYRVEDTPIGKFIISVADTPRFGSWTKYRDVWRGPQADIADLESIASSLRQYEPGLISGLLQTEEYSSALFAPEREGLRALGFNADRLLDFRNARKGVLYRNPRPTLEFVMSEVALRNTVGGPDVMHRQVRHLIELISEHGVDVRIYPIAAGHTSGMWSPLLLATIGTEVVAYLEGSPCGTLVDNKERVHGIEHRFGLIQSKALEPKDTITFLEEFHV